MMRRTVTLTIEIEGAKPNALLLRDAVLAVTSGNRMWRVTDALIIEDGYDRGPAPDKGPGPA